MRIVVNHLTRMQPGYICLAGLDLATGRHVRPVVKLANLTPRWLSRHGGPFDMAHVINLGLTGPKPDRPHVEDQVFQPCFAKFVEVEEAEAFWERLTGVSQTKLSAIFGSELKPAGRGRYGTAEGKGQASLGCWQAQGQPRLYLAKNQEGLQIRLAFSDGECTVDARVTDLRLCAADHVTSDTKKVQELAERMRASESLILSVGLTRAWASAPGKPRLHWLQVNNIHLKEDPTWRLG